jgi:hypothetical protein
MVSLWLSARVIVIDVEVSGNYRRCLPESMRISSPVTMRLRSGDGAPATGQSRDRGNIHHGSIATAARLRQSVLFATSALNAIANVGLAPMLLQNRLREATKRDSVVLTRIAARSIHYRPSEE